VAVIFSSCLDEGTGRGFESCFSLCCDNDSGSKTGLSESAFQLHDASVFVYDGDRLVTDAYSSSGGKITVLFPDAAQKYDVFVLANTGKVKAPSSESELRSLILEIPDLTGLSSRGIPMVGMLEAHLPEAATKVKVKMLCSQVELSFNHSAHSADYTIKSVRLGNCAGTVYPFAEASAADETVPFGDSLTVEEIASLQQGGKVFLYAIENMQGVLLPFNDDPYQKTPSNLPSSEVASRCTYLDVTADVLTPAALYSDVHFRTYLGEDITSDFNLVRSRNYRYELEFESNMIEESLWRIDPSQPLVLGEYQLSKTEAMVIQGISDTVFVSPVSANGKKLDFNISVEGADADKRALTVVEKDVIRNGKAAKALVISTSCPIDGLNDYKEEPDVKLCRVSICSRETFENVPLLKAEVDVKVFHQVFPIFLKTVPSGTRCKMYAYSNNPFKIPFSGSILVRQGQNLTGTARYFNSVVPDRGGALLAEIPCYEGGMAIFLKMKPRIAGKETDMYMGNLSTEYFGPGTDHAPANGGKFVSDDVYSMEYCKATNPEYRNYLARMSCSSGYVFSLDSVTPGWNCQDLYTLSNFSGKPFYFLNGGLQIYVASKTEDAPKYLDDSGRVGFTVFAFEPGRDLCLDTKYGSKGYCTFGALLGVMTQFFGNKHRWLAWRAYEYGVYLSINGCSCWAGATKGSIGYVLN